MRAKVIYIANQMVRDLTFFNSTFQGLVFHDGFADPQSDLIYAIENNITQNEPSLIVALQTLNIVIDSCRAHHIYYAQKGAFLSLAQGS